MPPTKQGARSRRWVFTLNNPAISGDELKADLVTGHLVTACLFQKEEGEAGTPHFQGCFSLKGPLYWGFINTWHKWFVEPCKDWEASLRYCSKEESRKDGPWIHNCSPPEAVEPPYTFKLETLRPWQQLVINLIVSEPDNRSIYWYHDSVGGQGKTVLCKHIVCNYNAIYVQGKAADIKSAISTMEKKPKIVLFGLPRSSEDFVSYDAIESCKDGIFFSGKYESGMCVFKPPHILIFANFLPDKAKLSSDRWNIIELSPAPPFSAYSHAYDEPHLSAAVSEPPVIQGNGLELSIASHTVWEKLE